MRIFMVAGDEFLELQEVGKYQHFANKLCVTVECFGQKNSGYRPRTDFRLFLC